MSLSLLLWPNNQAREISQEITQIPEIGLNIPEVSKILPKNSGKQKNFEKSWEFTVIPGKTFLNFLKISTLSGGDGPRHSLHASAL